MYQVVIAAKAVERITQEGNDSQVKEAFSKKPRDQSFKTEETSRFKNIKGGDKSHYVTNRLNIDSSLKPYKNSILKLRAQVLIR